MSAPSCHCCGKRNAQWRPTTLGIMFAPSVRIALSKACSPGDRADIATILERAEVLDAVESAFESKINASKAARGEGPTKVSSARRAQLNALAEDERQTQKEQVIALEALPVIAIVRVLHSALQSDVSFWTKNARHAHAADMHVVQEFIDAKVQLFESLGSFLAKHDVSDA